MYLSKHFHLQKAENMSPVKTTSFSTHEESGNETPGRCNIKSYIYDTHFLTLQTDIQAKIRLSSRKLKIRTERNPRQESNSVQKSPAADILSANIVNDEYYLAIAITSLLNILKYETIRLYGISTNFLCWLIHLI